MKWKWIWNTKAREGSQSNHP